MTILIVDPEDDDAIATWSISTEETPAIFKGEAVGNLFVRRADVWEAVDELERRLTVFAEWIRDREDWTCHECGDPATPELLAADYPLCGACYDEWDLRRQYD